MRGVTLGWLLREGCDHDSGSDSSDAAAEAAAADGGDSGCGGDATGHNPCGKAKRRGRAKGHKEQAPSGACGAPDPAGVRRATIVCAS